MKPLQFESVRSVLALLLREVSATYGRTPGGFLWAILEPVGFIVLLALGFSFVFHVPSLGRSFMLFYATGFLPVHIYSELSGKLMHGLRYSRPLLSYPKVLWIDALIARALLHLTAGVLVSVLIFAGIFAVIDHPSTLRLAPILIGFSMAAGIGIGIGTLNAYLTGRFEVWGRIWAILARPIFLSSAVFFVPENLADPLRSVIWWNPLTHAVGAVRSGIYHSYHPSDLSVFYGFGFALVTLVAGLLLLRAHQDRIL